MRKFKFFVVTFLSAILLFSIVHTAAWAQTDLTTQYRVYQNDNMLQEFANRNEAIQYARKYANSYVEEIGSRKWVWSQFPQYEVYQLDKRLGIYATMEEAIREARKWEYATVQNIHSKGWVWDNYPRYQLYQGHVSLDNWHFTSLEDAQAEARKWAGSHIIDLSNNRWVWDNISDERREQLRDRSARYQVYQFDYTRDSWHFASFEDAIREALKWKHSYVVNTMDNDKKVFSNEQKYQVYQNTTHLEDFIDIREAIPYALRWANATIQTMDGHEIWNNSPYYQVHEQNKRAVNYETIEAAVNYALQQPKAWITNKHGRTIWDNSTRLQYWAWTGSSRDVTIKSMVAKTQGLDVISPTWFKLLDAQGNVEDTSSPELVKWLKGQDLEIHPLLHNQFNSKLTTEFLKSEQAQMKFINTVVKRSAEIGVHGINIDFESLSGADRQAYTQFVKRFTNAAHEHGLKVSIDLPRGSLSWNHLTAFDHAELAEIVDYIITMTYDHHYSGSPTPGSVAGLQWVEQGVEEFLSYGIPRDKLIMGVPFYIREWKLDSAGKLVSNRAILSSAVPNLLQTKTITSTWDDRFNQYRMEYKEDGFTYVFWLEDQESMKARLDIAKEYNLAGISAWRLGQEAADMWDMLVHEK